MRSTCIYVDGFNLYYGLVKNTTYKWLDLKALFQKVLPADFEIQKIKYYTAIVSARENDPNAPIRQISYFNALLASTPEIEIHRGKFITKEVDLPLAADPGRFARVIKTEEKKSDVNLATHLLHDAWQHTYDCQVVVTNDSDMSETFRIIRKVLDRQLYLLIPAREDDRPHAIQLTKWTKKRWKYIPIDAVATSPLPDKIPGTNYHKPTEWDRAY